MMFELVMLGWIGTTLHWNVGKEVMENTGLYCRPGS